VGGTDRGEPWVGPYIFDQDGELIWSGAPLFDHFRSFDLRLAEVNGQMMLTVIYPHDNAAIVLNSSYQLIQRVVHSDRWEFSNMHEFNVVKNGSRALVLSKNETQQLSWKELEPLNFSGRCTVRADGLKFLDISLAPPKELFAWKGIDHISIEETLPSRGNIGELCDDDHGWDIQ
jgi:hypothetical protein